jgi:anti-anti-sigma regulatory factor
VLQTPDVHGFSLDEREIRNRLTYLGFSEEDAQRIRSYAPDLLPHADQIAQDLYAQINTLGDLAQILDGHLLQCKLKQSSYLAVLLNADVDSTYAISRAWVGEIHRNLGVDPHWYLASYSYLQGLILDQLEKVERLVADPLELHRVARSLSKLVFFDMMLAIEAQIQGERAAHKARGHERDESAGPALLEVWPGIGVLPITGRLDARQAERCSGAVLQAIAGQLRALILDLSRLPAFDRSTARVVVGIVEELGTLDIEVVLAGLTRGLEHEALEFGFSVPKVRRTAELADAVQELVGELDKAPAT